MSVKGYLFSPNPVSVAITLKTPTKLASIPQFIRDNAKIAYIEELRTGVPFEISLAQAVLEGACGTSEVAVQAKNHFGVKCFRKFHFGCCVDTYRRYESDLESWQHHSRVLNLKRYSSLKGKSLVKWANGLQELGYGTADRYAYSLIYLIKKYKISECKPLFHAILM